MDHCVTLFQIFLAPSFDDKILEVCSCVWKCTVGDFTGDKSASSQNSSGK